MPTRWNDKRRWHANLAGLMGRSTVKFRVLSRIAAGVGLVVAVVAGASPASAEVAGIDWTSRTSAADNNWYSVTYGNGLFVAVAGSGAGDRVMTSPDGITWTSRSSAADISWESVTYGNGLFVAVAYTGTGNRVMTSGSVASGGAGAGGGGSAAPQVVSVDPGLEAAELPASWSPSATLSSWKQLPASADVVGVGENAGKTFLGVATREDFPVAIAQRQVDNGWGAYEIYDADGRLASVFIPAGKSLHLTAVPRLHAIWNQ